MNLEQKKIIYILPLTLFASLALPLLAPQWHLMPFAPLLVILFYKKTKITCLWSALFSGLFLDLLSPEVPIGFHSCIYCFSTLILYRQRKNFFSDRFSTLPLMTFLFSFVTTLLQGIFLYLIDRAIPFSWIMVFTDFIYMPLLDSVYAFMIFSLPTFIFGKIPRSGSSYFAERKHTYIANSKRQN